MLTKDKFIKGVQAFKELQELTVLDSALEDESLVVLTRIIRGLLAQIAPITAAEGEIALQNRLKREIRVKIEANHKLLLDLGVEMGELPND